MGGKRENETKQNITKKKREKKYRKRVWDFNTRQTIPRQQQQQQQKCRYNQEKRQKKLIRRRLPMFGYQLATKWKRRKKTMCTHKL